MHLASKFISKLRRCFYRLIFHTERVVPHSYIQVIIIQLTDCSEILYGILIAHISQTLRTDYIVEIVRPRIATSIEISVKLRRGLSHILEILDGGIHP